VRDSERMAGARLTQVRREALGIATPTADTPLQQPEPDEPGFPWVKGADSDQVVKAMEEIAEVLFAHHESWNGDTLDKVSNIVIEVVSVTTCNDCGFAVLATGQPCPHDSEA